MYEKRGIFQAVDVHHGIQAAHGPEESFFSIEDHIPLYILARPQVACEKNRNASDLY
jgi:hypothetical protein